jgi:hydroxymethylglutaryl-CoA lyase
MLITEEKRIKILETPRDAMQGLQRIIPTVDKVRLIHSLLQVGFDIIDVGSIVSSSTVPQMKDTLEVLDRIDITGSQSKLFVLVVNQKGAKAAAALEKVSYIGFPFSTSPTFLKKNINSDFDKSWKTIVEIQNICLGSNKHFIVYLSMAFGNPYGDSSDIGLIYEWAEKLYKIGIKTISISDIIGVATTDSISKVYSQLSTYHPDVEFGIHLHIKADDGFDKIDAAFMSGCTLFDGVINGMGGCPMSGYELLGNLSTGSIINFAKKNDIYTNVDINKYSEAFKLANKILS